MSALAAPQRRGACPGLSAPMQTGDGLLVRLLPVGTIPLDAFAGLCAAARRHGNGVIETTSRGSIQVRGLGAATAPLFADTVAALGIAANDGMPIHCSPLAGLDVAEIVDAGALASDLLRASVQLDSAGALSPKVSVAIDGGGRLGLAELAADVRLCARKTNTGVALQVSVGGDNTTAVPLGFVALSDGVEAAVRLLDIIARDGRASRARDIIAAGKISQFHLAIKNLLDAELESRPRRNERSFQSPIGLHPLQDGSLACGIALAFGHSDTGSLETLSEAARTAGANGFRTAGRALLTIGIRPAEAARFATAAEQLGFIVDPNDPRCHVIACAGAPVCASAHLASRALAPKIAASAAAWLDDAHSVHISGCAKGCARAAPAALTIVGSVDGCALIAGGTVRDVPFANVTPENLPAAVAAFVERRVPEVAHG